MNITIKPAPGGGFLVKVEVFKETNPNTNGAIDSAPLGSGPYITKMTDPAYPQDTTWSSKCPSGCQFRQGVGAQARGHDGIMPVLGVLVAHRDLWPNRNELKAINRHFDCTAIYFD